MGEQKRHNNTSGASELILPRRSPNEYLGASGYFINCTAGDSSKSKIVKKILENPVGIGEQKKPHPTAKFDAAFENLNRWPKIQKIPTMLLETPVS